jgi:hypothetical protein
MVFTDFDFKCGIIKIFIMLRGPCNFVQTPSNLILSYYIVIPCTVIFFYLSSFLKMGDGDSFISTSSEARYYLFSPLSEAAGEGEELQV